MVPQLLYLRSPFSLLALPRVGSPSLGRLWIVLLGACLACDGAEPIGAVKREPHWDVGGLDGSILRLGCGVALRIDCGKVIDSRVPLACCGNIWSFAVCSVCLGHTGAEPMGAAQHMAGGCIGGLLALLWRHEGGVAWRTGGGALVDCCGRKRWYLSTTLL